MAFPDSTSVYQVSMMHLNKGDEIRISAAALPYARYFSFQTYGIPDFVSAASVRDVDILSLDGPNAYTNLTAAMAGEKQGGYELYITASGDKGYPNELKAFADGRESGRFVLFFRIYQDFLDRPPHPGLGEEGARCFGPHGLYPDETPQEWGWVCPPTVAIKRAYQRGPQAAFEPLPMCGWRRKYGFSFNDVTVPVINCGERRGNRQPNKAYNFFLPSPMYLKSKFANKDAKYLFSCAEAPHVPADVKMGAVPPTTGGGVGDDADHDTANYEPELWARVTGKLPRTASALYEPPFIANLSDYDVRYVSISSVGRSLPYKAYQTLHDADIANHYLDAVGPEWDRSFTVWMGPPHSTHETVPPIVAQEKAMFMPWGKSFRGEIIPFPGVLYRQILSRRQILDSIKNTMDRDCPATDDDDTSDRGVCTAPTAGIADIIPPTCDEAEGRENLCCGHNPPEWCHDPRFVASKMREFYPSIEYYHRRKGTEVLDRCGGEKDHPERMTIFEEGQPLDAAFFADAQVKGVTPGGLPIRERTLTETVGDCLGYIFSHLRS